MRYGEFLLGLLKYTVSGALALGLVLTALISASGANGEITLDIGLSGWDGLYLVLGLPLILAALFLLVSPLAWGLWRLCQRAVGIIRPS